MRDCERKYGHKLLRRTLGGKGLGSFAGIDGHVGTVSDTMVMVECRWDAATVGALDFECLCVRMLVAIDLEVVVCPFTSRGVQGHITFSISESSIRIYAFPHSKSQ